MKRTAAKRTKRKRSPARANKRQIAAFFDPEIGRELRVLAAETNRTVQSLMAESLGDLFARFGKHRLAEKLRPKQLT